MPDGNTISIDLDQSEYLRAKIKVVGVGGGGCNAVKNMIDGSIRGVELIAANTDAQALSHNPAKYKVQLGKKTTKGLGAGADPEVGKKAAEESEQDLTDILLDSDMIFVTCGMGGGTGTGAAPVVAKIAKETGALVVGIVSRPFDFEGKTRIVNAKRGIDELRKYVDAIIVIPNQKIYDIIGEDTDAEDAFKKIDEILFNSTRGISDIINHSGIINVDFADVRTIMKDKGEALMGIGISNGENRAKEAALNAINSPLLDGISIEGAQGLLVNITSGRKIAMREVSMIINTIQEFTGPDVNLIHGLVKTDDETDNLSVTVVATGFQNKNMPKVPQPVESQQNIFGEAQPNTKEKQDSHSNFSEQIRKVPNPDFTRFIDRMKSKENFQSKEIDKGSINQKPHEIPRGNNKLKELDEPAILRSQTTNVKINENNYTVFPESQPQQKTNEDRNINSNVEEIALENFKRGFDILNLPKDNNLNYFKRIMD